MSPLTMSAWLGLPLSQLTDRVIALADVAPRSADALGEAFASGCLGSAAAPTVRTIGTGWTPDPRLENAVTMLRGGRSVRLTAAAIGVSERHLERMFSHQIGMAPRLFTRILRFRHAMTLAKRGATLVGAAVSAGYADQLHFNRATRALAQRTPRALLPHVGNVQDLRAGSI